MSSFAAQVRDIMVEVLGQVQDAAELQKARHRVHELEAILQETESVDDAELRRVWALAGKPPARCLPLVASDSISSPPTAFFSVVYTL